MSRRNTRILTRCGAVVVLIAGAIYLAMGCGLGYIDSSSLPQSVYLRIENGTPNYLLVTLSTPDPPAAPTDGQTTTTQQTNDNVAPITARLRGFSLVEATGRKSALLAKQAVVRVAPGASSAGSVECVSGLSVKAEIEQDVTTPVVLTGVGSGTSGFDSGSVGLTGERLLTPGTDFDCADRLLIRVASSQDAEIVAIPAGVDLPDPITSSGGGGSSGGGDSGGDSSAKTIGFELQNATDAAVEFTIATVAPAGAAADDSAPDPTVIRIPGRQLTTGSLPCGPTYQVSGTIIDVTGVRPVTLTGQGTGTIGFDEGSIGASGERYLAFGQHYACAGTIVLTLTDDGSAVGSSVSSTPLGDVSVFSSGEPEPPVDLNDNADGSGSNVVYVRVRNNTESFVQATLLTGTDQESSTSVDIRVPPSKSTWGTVACAQRFVVRAAHLENADSVEGGGFHTVVLTGAGGGLEGFDENSVGTDNSRLLLLDTHFECDQTITITITATNNTVDPDSGDTVFGIGDGTVAVGES